MSATLCPVHEVLWRECGCGSTPIYDELVTVIPDPRVHCWADDDGVSTCMLLDDHYGEHVFTPDAEVSVSFRG